MKAQVRTSFTARTVGKIDEAHLLSHDQLEAIRMLTNSNLDSASPAGRPAHRPAHLRRSMKLGVLAALDQRIAVRYAMPPMTPPGDQPATCSITSSSPAAPTPLFSDDAAALIHHTARGYPRAVNRLAVAALIATYATRKTIVDETAARAAVTEVSDQ